MKDLLAAGIFLIIGVGWIYLVSTKYTKKAHQRDREEHEMEKGPIQL